MYFLYKRSNVKLAKKIRRKTTEAVTNFWEGMLTPAEIKDPVKPIAKRQVPKKAVRVTKPRKPRPKSNVANSTAENKLKIMPRDASFKTDVYHCEHGKRTYKIYIPSLVKTTDAALPLIIMLHGCNQIPDDFARGTGMNLLAEEFGFIVVYPEQERKSQTNRCWNWYKRSDQMRGSGEPALTASLTNHIVSEHNIDPAKVYIAGLSAGASSALVTATTYPDIFAGVGVHSGMAVGSAHDTSSAMFAMRYGMPGQSHVVPLPTIIFHGDADKVVNVRNSQYIAERANEPYPQLRRTQRNGYTASGQKYTRTSYRLGKGRSFVEQWIVKDAGHEWSGGNRLGTFTNPNGPNASREMIRFLFAHRTTQKWRKSVMDKKSRKKV